MYLTTALLTDFTCNLHSIRTNYFQNVLDLMSTLPGMRHLLFISEPNCPDPSGLSAPYHTYYIGKNIDTAFFLNHLQNHLISSDDILLRMTSGTYYDTVVLFPEDWPADIVRDPFVDTFLTEQGLSDPICLYLKDSSAFPGRILIFPDAESAAFSSEDRQLLGFLSQIITSCYRKLHKTNDITEIFHSFADDISIGCALLNSRLSILSANDAFSSFSEYILAHGTIDESRIPLTGTPQAETITAAQKLVNHLGSNILLKPDRIRIDCLLYHFRIYSKLIVSPNAFGAVETRYCIYMTQHKKIRNNETLRLLDSLTVREHTILAMITTGYRNEEIARSLSISLNTVKTHLGNIYRKMNVNSRNELIATLYLNKRHI